MQMTESEIVSRYEHARDRKTQIQILAELNACDKEYIIGILKDKGYDVDAELKKKAKPRKSTKPPAISEAYPAAATIESVPDAVKEALTLRMIAEQEEIELHSMKLNELSRFLQRCQ